MLVLELVLELELELALVLEPAPALELVWLSGNLWIVVWLKKECSFSGGDMWGSRDTQPLQDGKKNWTLHTKRQWGCKNFSFISGSLVLSLSLVLLLVLSLSLALALEIQTTCWNFHYLIFLLMPLLSQKCDLNSSVWGQVSSSRTRFWIPLIVKLEVSYTKILLLMILMICIKYLDENKNILVRTPPIVNSVNPTQKFFCMNQLNNTYTSFNSFIYLLFINLCKYQK